MGCCCSSGNNGANEKSALLQNDGNDSTPRSTSTSYSIMTRPKCKCGEKMNAYELQCCYINDNGDPFTGTINCDQCAKAMNNSHDIVWHCLKQHDFTFDLCFDCGSQLATSSKSSTNGHSNIIEENEEEKKQKLPNKFDPKYNTENINWNELYLIMCDEAKGMKIHNILKQNLDLSNLDQYNFPDDIINFIHHIIKQVEMTQIVHNACLDDQGWIIQADQDNITISYKKEEDNPFHSIRSNYLCECSVLDFIATLNEFDLIGDLIKIVKVESRMLKEFTNSDKVCKSELKTYVSQKSE